MNKNTNIKTVEVVQGIGAVVDWKKKENKQLLEAFAVLENTEETARFLRDLMTVSEIEEFSKRLEAASLLSKDAQYNTIVEKTGLSSATIARIAKWLKGSLGGYRLVINKLHHHNPSKLKKGLLLNT